MSKTHEIDESDLVFADEFGRALAKEAGLGNWIADNITRPAMRKAVQRELSSRAGHMKEVGKNLKEVGKRMGAGAAVGAGAGAVSGASAKIDPNNPNDAKVKRIAKRALGGAAAGAVIGGATGHKSIKGAVQAGKKAVDFSKAASMSKEALNLGGLGAAIQKGIGHAAGAAVRSPLATRAAVGAAGGAVLGAGKHMMSNNPNSSLLGSMAGGAVLGAGAGAGAKALAMRAGAGGGAVGKYVRGGMAAAGEGRLAGRLGRVSQGAYKHPAGLGGAGGIVPRENYVKKHEALHAASNAKTQVMPSPAATGLEKTHVSPKTYTGEAPTSVTPAAQGAKTQTSKPTPHVESITVTKKRTPGSHPAPAPSQAPTMTGTMPSAATPGGATVSGRAARPMPTGAAPTTSMKPGVNIGTPAKGAGSNYSVAPKIQLPRA